MIRLEASLVLARIQDQIRVHLPQAEAGLRAYHEHIAIGVADAINESGGVGCECASVTPVGLDLVLALLLQRKGKV